jgi:ABC-type cobalamin/Fe3+-siderophores transport system ATPase subunit
MSPEWVLKAESLRIGYGRRRLLHDLSFAVTRGEILGIVGPNGCGKTTLLRTMLGLVEPLGGRVERPSGLSVSDVPQRVRSPERDAAQRALALLGIESLSQRLFRNLSTGQQRSTTCCRRIA